ncbi:MAG TPA: sugar isomerase [Rhodospirillaceae bacterium]|nr:sugar isomerase [Magnetovibrio sp.]HBT43828.1 sugar isomerase [Rhodospirillaceae bacterium]HCS70888.1 sugar isomerase [Rhodospirillaceae bacterium]
MSHAQDFMKEAATIALEIDADAIERMAQGLAQVRSGGGRLFLLGVGGSAGNCSHATNDFRKLCGMEAYAPTDNVSELTARINDEGWDTVFAEWLKTSRLSNKDAILVFSVGGGDAERNVSVNLIRGLEFAKSKGAKIFGVVGRKTGYTAQVADAAVVVPVENPQHVTPHTEAFQAVVWHCLVSHPLLQTTATKW